MCIVYVYDIIFWARNEDGIHDLEMELRELGVDLEQEDDADGFICVNIERDLKTGLLDMKQIGLIQRVINAVVLYFGISKGKFTPSEDKSLGKDDNGEP